MTKAIQIRIDDDLLTEVDKLTGPEVSRSTVIRTALRSYLRSRPAISRPVPLGGSQ